MPPKKPTKLKITLPPIPPIPDEEDFLVEDELVDPKKSTPSTTATDEDEDLEDDYVDPEADEADNEDESDEEGDEDESGEEEDDDDDSDERRRKERDRRRKEEEKKKKEEEEQKKKDEEQKKNDEENEPGKQREENPNEEANEDPRLNKSKTEGSGSEGGVGEGATGLEEGAELAAETTEAVTATTEAATTAAEVTTAAVEGGAAVTATAPEWLPILGVIVIVVIAVVVIFTIGRSIWHRVGHSGDTTGSRATAPANVSDTNLREQVAELAVAAGDTAMRATLTKEKLADVFTRLDSAARAATGHPAEELLMTHITAAKSAASVLVESTSTSRGDEYIRQLKQFQYHTNAIAAILMGIGNDSPATLVARANDAFSLKWVRTANDRDKNAPLRDGSNTIKVGGTDTHGCDPAGFITYVLHNPQITSTDPVAPNLVDLPKAYSAALATVDMSGGYKADLLQAGDIILTKFATSTDSSTKTTYGAFIYLGGDPKQVAYCGPSGPAKMSTDSLSDAGRTVTGLLRLKTAP